MIVLTTMHNIVKVTQDQRQKPNVHIMYDYTKGGVDIVDLLSTHHSTRMKTKRWPINALAFGLDTCRTNSKTILADNKVQFHNFEFIYELGKSLFLPNIERRYANQIGLQISIINKMRKVLGIQEVSRRPPMENAVVKCGCCCKYVEGIVGSADYKKDREKLNNKIKSKCFKCGLFLCKAHQKAVEYICEDCFVVDE